MIHPDTELRWAGDRVGWGVFATAPILCGAIVYARDDLEVEVQRGRLPHLHPLQAGFVNRYGYRDEQGNWVVSIDNARFVNHSCNSNTLSTGYGFEIAVRDIRAGEQITDDYGLLNLDYTMPCECGSANCRRQVGTNDLHRYHRQWDAVCQQALGSLPCVPQPIMELVPYNTIALIQSFLAGDERAYRSVLCLAGAPVAQTSPVLLA